MKKGTTIHYKKGHEAERERAICIRHYDGMCRAFRVKRMTDAALAKLTSIELYRLCEDVFNRQSPKARRIYAEREYGETNPDMRRDPLALKWFWSDRCRYLGKHGVEKVIDFLSLPITYPAFLKRKAAAAEKAATKLHVVKEGA